MNLTCEHCGKPFEPRLYWEGNRTKCVYCGKEINFASVQPVRIIQFLYPAFLLGAAALLCRLLTRWTVLPGWIAVALCLAFVYICYRPIQDRLTLGIYQLAKKRK